MLQAHDGFEKDVLKTLVTAESNSRTFFHPRDSAMEPAGWIVMTASVGSVITLLTFCLFRVFTLPPVPKDDAEE